MSLKYGILNIIKSYVGNQQVKLYLGSNLIFNDSVTTLNRILSNGDIRVDSNNNIRILSTNQYTNKNINNITNSKLSFIGSEVLESQEDILNVNSSFKISVDNITKHIMSTPHTGELSINDNIISRGVLKDYSQTIGNHTLISGLLTLDYSTGNVFNVLMIEDITNINIINTGATGKLSSILLYITQDTTGQRILDLSFVKFSKAHDFGLSPHAEDVIQFISADGGIVWYGLSIGSNFN